MVLLQRYNGQSDIPKRFIFNPQIDSFTMKKCIFFIAAAAIAASSALVSCNKVPASVQRLEAIAAAGDTITESKLYNMFIIKGATVTPEMYENYTYLRPQQIASSDRSDNDIAVVYHNGDVAVSNKCFIANLFPSATKFTLDGDEVTREQFYAVPASMLLTVTSSDNGTTLAATTRGDVDDPNPAHKAAQDAEQAWIRANLPALSTYYRRLNRQMVAASSGEALPADSLVVPGQ